MPFRDFGQLYIVLFCPVQTIQQKYLLTETADSGAIRGQTLLSKLPRVWLDSIKFLYHVTTFFYMFLLEIILFKGNTFILEKHYINLGIRKQAWKGTTSVKYLRM
jgi:hypothetical protein